MSALDVAVRAVVVTLKLSESMRWAVMSDAMECQPRGTVDALIARGLATPAFGPCPAYFHRSGDAWSRPWGLTLEGERLRELLIAQVREANERSDGERRAQTGGAR